PLPFWKLFARGSVVPWGCFSHRFFGGCLFCRTPFLALRRLPAPLRAVDCAAPACRFLGPLLDPRRQTGQFAPGLSCRAGSEPFGARARSTTTTTTTRRRRPFPFQEASWRPFVATLPSEQLLSTGSLWASSAKRSGGMHLGVRSLLPGRMTSSCSGQEPCSAAAEPADLARDTLLHEWVDHRHFEEIESTQTFVEREYESFDPGRLTAVSADFQSAGRGTRDRVWKASQGQSILVTFFFRFPAECETDFVNRNAPNVTKVLAVAAIETLRWAAAAEASAPGSASGQGLEFGMKWPNDVVVSGQKVAGVLARAIPCGGRLDGIIVGIGINVNTPQADLDQIVRPVWPAGSLRSVTGDRQVYDLPAIRRRLLGTFAVELRSFFSGGFPAFRHRVNELEVLMGTQVRFRLSETEEVDGVFEGIQEDGLIQLRLAGGEVKSYVSGEIVPKT
ncbi:unnamed protein product, partial [Polarella glacialis]